MNPVNKYIIAPLIALTLAFSGCGKEDQKDHMITKDNSVSVLEKTAKPRDVSVNGSDYLDSGSDIIQKKSSFLDDNEINIGLVSDLEGAVENAKVSAKKLSKQNIDAVIIAGDCYENEKIRRNPVYPNSTDNLKEMIESIRPYAELNVPVFIIAGNHEMQSVYNDAIKELQEEYPYIFDINEKSVDLEGVNIIGMGGYNDPRFTARYGFLLENKDYKRAEEDLDELQSQKEIMIFVTHGPPRSDTRIDYVRGAGHVGDKKTAEIMNSDLEDVVNVHGHIHEGGGASDKYKAGAAINVASIISYMNKGSQTTLINIKDNKVQYKKVD
ncbi:hypothetical protein GF361_02500 [Candidatus Woesearchaeota archaeon]|nr:hypothetical protein [Candidatus Woesearchaeota archaeon]